MWKKLSLTLIVICMILIAAAGAEGALTVEFGTDAPAAGETVRVLLSSDDENASRVIVNATMVYMNGTADLMLVGQSVPLENGKAVIELTPAHEGTLKVEARRAGADEESVYKLVKVTGDAETWPTGTVTAPETCMVQDRVLWGIAPQGAQAPYTVRYHVTLFSENGGVKDAASGIYRSDGETVWCETVFGETGSARLEAEITDRNGLKCYTEKEITIQRRPFYTAVEKTLLKEGESLQIHPYTDEDPWRFISSDESVLTVGEHGQVTALQAGSATVSVTSDENDHREQIPFVVSPRGEEVVCDPVTLPVGQSAKLEPRLRPEGAESGGWIFVSTRPDVIRIDEDGTVEALLPGESSVVVICGADPRLTAAVPVRAAGPEEEYILPFTDGIALETDEGGAFLTARYGAQLADTDSEYTLTLKRDGEIYAVKQRSGDGQVRFAIHPLKEGRYTLDTTVRDGDGRTVTVTSGADIVPDGRGGYELKNITEHEPEVLSEEIGIDLDDTVYVGVPQKALVTISPEGAEPAIKWASSDPDVIEVDEFGGITVLKDGYAVITATALDHTGVTASREVRAVTETLSVGDLPDEIRPGDSFPLRVTSGTGTGYVYRFSSTDPGILTVENGVLTAKKTGTAAVIVRAEDKDLEISVPVTVLECLHRDGEWRVDSEATCVRPGQESFHCAVCGQVPFSREIPATGHDRGRWSTLIPPTQSFAGQKGRACTACGEIVEKAVIPALDYTLMNGNTAGLEGLYLRDYDPAVKEWYMFAPVDLTKDGVSTFRLIASNMLVIGTVTARVEDGSLTVSYDLVDDELTFTDEFITFLPAPGGYGSVDLGGMKNYAFEVPVSIQDDLGGAGTACMLIINRLNYNGCESPYPKYKDTDPAHQQSAEQLRKLLER